jgi:hypothetical protein
MYRPVLMDSVGIRRRLKVSRQRAYQIVAHKSFPAPSQVLVLGKVWDAVDVEAWIEIYRPNLVCERPGGSSKSDPDQAGTMPDEIKHDEEGEERGEERGEVEREEGECGEGEREEGERGERRRDEGERGERRRDEGERDEGGTMRDRPERRSSERDRCRCCSGAITPGERGLS